MGVADRRKNVRRLDSHPFSRYHPTPIAPHKREEIQNTSLVNFPRISSTESSRPGILTLISGGKLSATLAGREREREWEGEREEADRGNIISPGETWI